MLRTCVRLGLFQNIAKTLRIGNAKYIVGHDLAGNSYLELPSLSGSTDPRHTRRSIQWAEKRELGDYDQRSIPVQWVMWLRHTRRQAPTIEELVQDRQRIELTQANAARLALEYQQSKEREQQLRAQQNSLHLQSGAPTLSTSAVIDETLDEHTDTRLAQQAQESHASFEPQRTPDQDVWAASRARLAAKAQPDASLHEPLPTSAEAQQLPETLQNAIDRRAAIRAGRDEQEAERQRARREMSKSPLDAFVPMPKPRS